MFRIETSPQIRTKKPLLTPVVIRLCTIDEAAAARVRTELEAAVTLGQPFIPIVIDSEGGDQYAQLSILDAITEAKRRANVVTVADGKAMSAGAEILAAGTRGHRFVSPNATVMIHDAHDPEPAGGTVTELSAATAEIRRVHALCYGLLDKHAGKRPGYFERCAVERGRADWYLTSAECLRHGIADRIGYPVIQVQIGISWQLTLPGPGPRTAPHRPRPRRKR